MGVSPKPALSPLSSSPQTSQPLTQLPTGLFHPPRPFNDRRYRRVAAPGQPLYMPALVTHTPSNRPCSVSAEEPSSHLLLLLIQSAATGWWWCSHLDDNNHNKKEIEKDGSKTFRCGWSLSGEGGGGVRGVVWFFFCLFTSGGHKQDGLVFLASLFWSRRVPTRGKVC